MPPRLGATALGGRSGGSGQSSCRGCCPPDQPAPWRGDDLGSPVTSPVSAAGLGEKRGGLRATPRPRPALRTLTHSHGQVAELLAACPRGPRPSSGASVPDKPTLGPVSLWKGLCPARLVVMLCPATSVLWQVQEKPLVGTLSGVLLAVTESDALSRSFYGERRNEFTVTDFCCLPFKSVSGKQTPVPPSMPQVTPSAGAKVSGATRRSGSEASRIPLPRPGPSRPCAPGRGAVRGFCRAPFRARPPATGVTEASWLGHLQTRAGTDGQGWVGT